jgi:type II secretory pathway component PulF
MMREERQYQFLSILTKLVKKGYPLEEAFHYLSFVEPQLVKKMKNMIEEAIPLSTIFKRCRFKPFVSDLLEIGLESHQLDYALTLILEQFEFYFSIKKSITKLLLYPCIIFVVALFCFEFLRLSLYPTIQKLLHDFEVSLNPQLVFFAFNSLKMILLFMIVISLLNFLFPRLKNGVMFVKRIHSLFFLQQLKCLLTSGFSLLEAEIALKGKKHQLMIKELESYLIHQTKPPLSYLDPSFLSIFHMGMESNQLLSILEDFQSIYLDIVKTACTKWTYTIQFGLLLVIASNIFMIYAVIMLPLFQLSNYL